MTASTTQEEGQGMKLGTVFAAKEALVRLVALRMPSKVAYRVLKFSRKFDVEFGVVDEQRQKAIHEATGTKDGEDAAIENGTPEMATFFEKFAPALEVECELALCPLKFSELLDAIDAEEGNSLSAQDLALLEPLFESDENVKPELEVVK